MSTNLRYRVKALNDTGQVVSETVMAASENHAHQELTARGLSPLEVKAAGGAGGQRSLFQKRISGEDMMLFFRQLALMLKRGVPPLRALEVMAEQVDHPKLRAVITDMCRAVEEGANLGEAFGRHPRVFKPSTVSLIAAGESGGARDEVLEQIADSLKADEEISKAVKSALIYPAIVMLVVIAISIFLILVVVPSMLGMLEAVGGELPLPTKILMGIADAAPYTIVPLAALGVIAGVWWARNRNEPKVKAIADPIKIKLPVFGPLMLKIAVSRAVRNLGLMLGNGVPMGESLTIVAPASGNTVVAGVLERARDAVVNRGAQLHEHISEGKIFPPMVAAMTAMGGESGSIPEMLNEIADVLDAQAKALADRLQAALQPLITVLLGGVVGFIMFAMMMPIFSVYDNIG